jgi:hypothetical protein
MNIIVFNNEPILQWKTNGVYIYNKGYEYDKNLFIYYHTITCVSYNEKKCPIPPENTDDNNPDTFTQSKITVYLANNMVIEIIFDEEAPYIYDDFLHKVK